VTTERADTVSTVFLRILSDPAGMFLRRWNWKAAVMSSLLRAHLFLAANATAGARKAFAAAGVELLFRFIVSGFYGSLTQAFRGAEPAWAAAPWWWATVKACFATIWRAFLPCRPSFSSRRARLPPVSYRTFTAGYV
jgi:hypothetical protein